jgi:hypothetical protein
VQTLVVNLPQEKCQNMPRKSSHQQVRLTFKDQIPNKGAKIRPHKCEFLCYVQMRGKHPQYIVYHDLLINFRSLKIADKATNQKSYYFTLNY